MLIVPETVLLVTMVCNSGGKLRKSGEEVTFWSDAGHVCLSFVSNPVEQFPAASIEQAIAEDFATISDVRHVLISDSGDALEVWIAVDQPTAETRATIFDKQLAIFDAFPETEFDFNLVDASGRSAKDIVSGVPVYFSRG